MTRQRTCPSCQASVPVEEGPNVEGGIRRCPTCGAALPPEHEPNPYAAPKLPFDEAEEPERLPSVPATFAGKYLAAFTVFFLNFKILAPLVLFISLPANLLINYYKFKYVSNDLEILQLTLIASGVFGPIPIAAIHYALSRRMSGEPVSIFDALSQGMNRWLPLFLAQVVKGFIILAGLIALIIPAFYFAARYALLDPVVVLEHASEPRLRSAELVRGRAWEILGAILLFQVTVFGFAFLVQSIPRSSDPIYAMILECGLDCVLDLFASIGSVLIFLYYWECRHAKGARIDEAIV